MPLHQINAVFMRGGTSKALVFHQRDLPLDRADWAPIFLAAMGSPDPYGRQLDGMGGGLTSLSKVCVVGPPTHPQADVDYTFAQVSVSQATVDYSGNCGNMSSAIGPFAIDEGLVQAAADGEACVRIHNTNTGKLIVARFRTEAGRAAVRGPLAIDGVAGTGAPIRLEFRDLAGAKTGRLLPTGLPVQALALPDGRSVRASLVDAANPCMFVDAAELGCTGTEAPEEIERNAGLMASLETLRRVGSVAMGIAPSVDRAAQVRSIPFIGMVARMQAHRVRGGGEIGAGDADLCVRMLSNGMPHRAIPITSALCVAVACRTPDTLPAALSVAGSGPIRIAHPSGIVVVEADREPGAAAPSVRHASVYRTARRLFQGQVLFSDEEHS